MLKMPAMEAPKLLYFAKRVALLFTRFSGIPTKEPAGISLNEKPEQKSFLYNDVEAYQDASKVSSLSL